jgi:peptidyl-prolyl cis-trans isomerase D
MVNILRRYKQPLMIIVTIFVVVTFAWWGPSRPDSTGRNNQVTVIRGKPVTLEMWQREARRMRVLSQMGGAYAVALDPRSRFGQMSRAGIENSLLFDEEADALGVVATEEEVKKQVEELPAFMGADGRFDPARFDMFVERVLNPEGFNKSQIEPFLSSEVRIRKVAQLLASTVPVTPVEVKQSFLRQRLTTEASYVVVKGDELRKEQKVTEEEIKKRYDVKKDFLKTTEQRKVRFAAFSLPPLPEPKPGEAKPADESKRTEQLQQLANTAYDFASAIVQPGANFDELAKKAGATVGETAAFFGRDAGPAEIEGSVKAAEAAFELTKEKPYSRHISLLKGTYVLALKEIKPPEQLTLEQARKQIEEELLNEKTDTAMRAKAGELRGKLVEARKAGKSFADAAKSLGLTAEPFPAVSAMQPPPPGTPYSNVVPNAARKLAPGEISEVIIDKGAALIVHVDQRPVVDEKGMEEAKSQITAGLEGARMGIAFEAWLAERRAAAGLKDEQEP